MVRLTALLCGGLFVVLLIAGEDKGQLRQGLMTPPIVAQAPAPQPMAVVKTVAPAVIAQPTARVTEAVFVPAQPVRVEPAAPATVVVEPEPVVPVVQDRLAVVTARSANVRSGPSTTDRVIGRLTAGEDVLVVVEENGIEGWSLVRIEGDGVFGYVASRLLQPVAP